MVANTIVGVPYLSIMGPRTLFQLLRPHAALIVALIDPSDGTL